MLNDNQRSQMTAMQAMLMTETGTIMRKTLVANGIGGQTVSEASAGTVMCRVAPSGQSPQERAIAERLGLLMPFTVVVPNGTVVSEKDAIVVAGRRFEVKGVIRHSLATALRCVCVAVT